MFGDSNDRNLSFEQARWKALQNQNSTSFASSSTDFAMSPGDNAFSNTSGSVFDFEQNSLMRVDNFGTAVSATDKDTPNSSFKFGANDPFDFTNDSGSTVPSGTGTDPVASTDSKLSFNFNSPAASDGVFGTATNADPFSSKSKGAFSTSTSLDFGTSKPALSNNANNFGPATPMPATTTGFDFQTPSPNTLSTKKSKDEFLVQPSANGPVTPMSSKSGPNAATPSSSMSNLDAVSNLMQVASAMIKQNESRDGHSHFVSEGKSFKSKYLYPRRMKRRSRRLSPASRKLLTSKSKSFTQKICTTPIKSLCSRSRRSFASPYSGWRLQNTTGILRVR